MSEEQISALLARLKDDPGFRDKVQNATDLDDVVSIAKEAGFDIGNAEWLRLQAKHMLELSDEELEAIAGGGPNGEQCARNFSGGNGYAMALRIARQLPNI